MVLFILILNYTAFRHTIDKNVGRVCFLLSLDKSFVATGLGQIYETSNIETH